MARFTRSSFVEILQEDYIRTARAKGLSERLVVIKHGLRNALIPIVTMMGLQFSFLLGGSIVAWIVPYDPETFFDYDNINGPPSWQHLFGLDALGRDIFSRILAGTRISLSAGFSSVMVGAVVGTTFGLLAGYFEGWWDRVVMRICDVLFAFPGILLAISVVAILGSGMTNVIMAVAIFSIPTFARLVRGNTLALKRQTYVEAARSIGASHATIMLRHM